MARNPVSTEAVELSLNSRTVWYLDRMIETGLYGNNRAEAAKIALLDHCKLLVADGKLQMAPQIPGAGAVQVA